jgi:hypothetical protein
MSLVEVIVTGLRAFLLKLGLTVSRFEAETLHIPPFFRFFEIDAGSAALVMQASMFAAAPLHAFFTMPFLEKLVYTQEARSWRGYLLHGLGWYFQYFVAFWSAMLIVSASKILKVPWS